MHTSDVLVTHWEKISPAGMSFWQIIAIEFLVKDGNSAQIIYMRLHGAYGDAFVGNSSGWNIFRTETWTLPISRTVADREVL